jgi:hypothetical protein
MSELLILTGIMKISGVSEVFRKNKKGDVIIPDDNIT